MVGIICPESQPSNDNQVLATRDSRGHKPSLIISLQLSPFRFNSHRFSSFLIITLRLSSFFYIRKVFSGIDLSLLNSTKCHHNSSNRMTAFFRLSFHGLGSIAFRIFCPSVLSPLHQPVWKGLYNQLSNPPVSIEAMSLAALTQFLGNVVG